MFCKNGVLKNFTKFTGKHLFKNLLLKLQACNFIKKETLAQVFSCEFCENSKNTFFYRTPPVAASKELIVENRIIKNNSAQDNLKEKTINLTFERNRLKHKKAFFWMSLNKIKDNKSYFSLDQSYNI